MYKFKSNFFASNLTHWTCLPHSWNFCGKNFLFHVIITNNAIIIVIIYIIITVTFVVIQMVMKIETFLSRNSEDGNQ